jgi:hypothetical protein
VTCGSSPRIEAKSLNNLDVAGRNYFFKTQCCVGGMVMLDRDPPEAQMTLADWAVLYAENGFKVFPCHTVKEEGRCSCGEYPCGKDNSNAGKHPWTKNGFKDATNDPQKVRAIWRKLPHASIGLPTGKETNFVVVDPDGPTGQQSLKALEAAHGVLPETRWVETGREGGLHGWFRWPDGFDHVTSHRIAPDLDIKGDGGYVIAPPSLHRSGKVYAFRNELILAKCPAWLSELANGQSNGRDRNAFEEHGDSTREQKEPWSEAAEAKLRSALEVIPSDDRDKVWLPYGAAIYRLEWGNGWAIFDWWSSKSPNYSSKGNRKTWESFERPYSGKPTTLGSIYADAKARGWTWPKASAQDKPRLLIESSSPERTVEALRDIFVAAGSFFDRGVPVRLIFDQMQKGMVAHVISPDSLIMMAHSVCRPRTITKSKDEVDARLPKFIATMYLDWRGEWALPPLNGVAASPLLREDGTIVTAEGYDAASGMWCERPPKLDGLIPDKPTQEQAAAAQLKIRNTFRTFCFADAVTVRVGDLDMVDTTKPPGKDESAFLVALQTAVCRASLWLAPGVIFRAAPMSGAGTGKGLLGRCICAIAFGQQPSAMTGTANAEEFEKRISASLMEGGPTLFVDNLNGANLKSDLLASAITAQGRPKNRIQISTRGKAKPLAKFRAAVGRPMPPMTPMPKPPQEIRFASSGRVTHATSAGSKGATSMSMRPATA